MKILGVHYVLDEATKYCSFWVQRILQEASRLGHETNQLYGSSVSELQLKNMMETYQPDLAILGGHGSPREYFGTGLKAVLTTCINDQMMTGGNTIFISCLTGIYLVPSMVSKGAQVVSGYVKEFTWMIDGSGNPSSDIYAKSFERILVEPTVKLLSGGSWSEYHGLFHKVCNEEINYWNNSRDPVAPSVVLCLQQDRDAQIVNGAGSMDFYVDGVPMLLPVGLGLGALLLLLPP